MAMLSALEADWLEYARSIAACDPTHRAECVQRGGGSAVGPDPELRWPGFIGSDYEANPFRVLCVAQIHNPNGWSASASGLAPMEPLLREWLDGWLRDEAFLAKYRDEYAQRLPTWGPWRKAFGPVLRDPRIGLSPTEIAYVNIAKCWLSPGANQYELMRSCERWKGIASLLAVVKPDAVVFLSGKTPLRYAGVTVPEDVPWRFFSGRSFILSAANIETMIAWLAQVKADSTDSR
jgi:hypothetical protein